uniref:Putative secreted protein n=1 Tax=Anopheles darlingi TaxID=43151 RepID=A0A2M4DKR7_ANODA
MKVFAVYCLVYLCMCMCVCVCLCVMRYGFLSLNRAAIVAQFNRQALICLQWMVMEVPEWMVLCILSCPLVTRDGIGCAS